MIKISTLLLLVVATGCAGPKGNTGPTGIAGPAGIPGPSGVCVVQPAVESSGVDITCPDGTQVHLDDGATYVCPIKHKHDDKDDE